MPNGYRIPSASGIVPTCLQIFSFIWPVPRTAWPLDLVPRHAAAQAVNDEDLMRGSVSNRELFLVATFYAVSSIFRTGLLEYATAAAHAECATSQIWRKRG
jgi:hypothetical protein